MIATASMKENMLVLKGANESDVRELYVKIRKALCDGLIEHYRPICFKVYNRNRDESYNSSILNSISGLSVSIQDLMKALRDLILMHGEGFGLENYYRLKNLDTITVEIELPLNNIYKNKDNIRFYKEDSMQFTFPFVSSLNKDLTIPTVGNATLMVVLQRGTGYIDIQENSRLVNDYHFLYPLYTDYSLSDYVTLPMQDFNKGSLEFIFKRDIDVEVFKAILKNYLDKEGGIILI